MRVASLMACLPAAVRRLSLSARQPFAGLALDELPHARVGAALAARPAVPSKSTWLSPGCSRASG